MVKTKDLYSSKITVLDVCQEINRNLDVVKIQNDPSRMRLLMALLSTKLNNQFKMVTDFTNLDSHLLYMKKSFSNYMYRWRHISLIQMNTSEFIEDTKNMILMITPTRSLAV